MKQGTKERRSEGAQRATSPRLCSGLRLRRERTRRPHGHTAAFALALLLLSGIGDPRTFTSLPRSSAPSPLSCLAADPPAAEEHFTVVRAGKIITNAGPDIADGVIVLVNGKVRSVGHGLEYPLNAKVIDARDRVVMPGLIDPSSRFGLPNYGRNEVHANWSVADEYFPAPGVYDEILDAGFTALALVPAGGGIPGRAIVVRTAGPADQRVLLSPAFLRVTPDTKVFRGALEKAQAEIEKVDKARAEFEKKQEQEKKAASQPATTQATSQPTTAATQPAFQPPPIDPVYQPLVDLIQKKPGFFALIELTTASDFVHMTDVLAKFDIAHNFLARNAGESDFEYVVAKLGERKAKIILQPLISRRPSSVERINLVRELSKAGCEVSLTPASDSPQEFRRMLGRIAGLVREGWPRDEALKATSLFPARLLGLDARLGSVEKGKEADLIFLDADPLDPRARVREVMIGGEIVRRANSSVRPPSLTDPASVAANPRVGRSPEDPD